MKSDHKFDLRDDEETLFDGRRPQLSAAGVNEDKMNQKLVDKNLKIINLILILFGLLSVTFIVSMKSKKQILVKLVKRHFAEYQFSADLNVKEGCKT